MRFCPIASGSSGNCIYTGTEQTHILLDAGISGKATEFGLNTLDLTGRDISAIFVTHEHSDHIKGIGVMARKYGIPIYGTSLTLDAIMRDSSVGKIDKSLFRVIQKDEDIVIGDLTISPMKISHDAADPVAYRIHDGKHRVAVCTDLGYYTDYTVGCLQNMDVILLEANHDIRMLQVGPYPYPLKQRILGDKGHLSNEASGRLLSRILCDKTREVILGHLSKENNIPELAYESVRLEITMSKECPYTGDDFHISVAKRSEPSPVVEL